MPIPDQQNDPVAQDRNRGRGRRTLLLLLVISLLPVALAVYLHQTDWRPSGRHLQHGELISPARPLPEVRLHTPDDKPLSLQELRGRWLLISLAPDRCADACRQALWKMQQVRLAQAKDMQRVERVLIARHGEARLAADFPGTLVLRADAAAYGPLAGELTGLNPARDELAGRLQIVDPHGNLVLRYPADIDPARLQKDLARLLRLSQIG